MAILIKGMEMPESCFLCRFCRRQEYGEYVGEDTAWSCVASKKRITDGQDLIATFKHPDCPLVEVPDEQQEIIQCEYCENWDTSWECSSGPDYHYCPMIDKNTAGTYYCGDAERRINGTDLQTGCN